MKKLFVTLVLMSASLCALAQPDYISQAQAAVKKYYPQHVEYFNPIFTQINSISQGTKVIVNQKIKENLDVFDEELSTDKDKMTTILLALEQLTSKNQFRIFSDVGIKDNDDRLEIAKEIVSDINIQIKKLIDSNKLKASKLERRNEKLREILELSNQQTIDKETAYNIISKMEEFFCLFEEKEFEENTRIDSITKKYIILTKECGITPSAKGEKAIDAYNKRHK